MEDVGGHGLGIHAGLDASGSAGIEQADGFWVLRSLGVLFVLMDCDAASGPARIQQCRRHLRKTRAALTLGDVAWLVAELGFKAADIGHAY